MKPADLLERHAAIWQAATTHPFLDAVRDGTLPASVFATWLVQDYLFVTDEFAFQAHLLPEAPRAAQALLLRSLMALEAELGWFEKQAQQLKLVLTAQRLPVTVAYATFMHQLAASAPYPVVVTALWAIERAYLQAWMNIAPAHPTYQSFVEHWANQAFANFVAELESAAADALAPGGFDKETEASFLEVARLERAFWGMVWSGGAK